MHRDVAIAHPPKQHRQRHLRQRPSLLGAGEHKLAVSYLRHLLQNGDGPRRQWDAVFFAGLHASRGERPHARAEVDLVPARAERLARAGRRQDQELKRTRSDARLLSEQRHKGRRPRRRAAPHGGGLCAPYSWQAASGRDGRAIGRGSRRLGSRAPWPSSRPSQCAGAGGRRFPVFGPDRLKTLRTSPVSIASTGSAPMMG